MLYCLHPQDAQEAGLKSSPAAKPKTRIVKKTQSETTKKRTRQDPPGDKARPRKRQRTATPAESGSEESSLSSVDEAVGEDSVDERPSTDTKKAPEEPNKGHKAESIPKANDKKPAIESQSEPDGEDGPVSVPSKANGEPQDAGSESEMSEVLDKAPPPKKKGRKVSDTSRKDKKPAKSKPKEDSNLNPQEAEIKRLQSWLLKCGIRKLWHKELAPYPSPKAKINHLKSMLKEAGMDGRYSAEKAKQIREERELQAELEAVQEGAKHWGQPEVDEDDVKRPKRRLAKGLRELDFLADEDGEETE